MCGSPCGDVGNDSEGETEDEEGPGGQFDGIGDSSRASWEQAVCDLLGEECEGGHGECESEECEGEVWGGIGGTDDEAEA